jgi:hypothetical protein
VFNQLYQYGPQFKTWWDELNVRDQMGLRVLNNMIDDELVRAEAERLEITVTQDDINEEIRQLFGFEPASTDNTPVAESTGEPEPTDTLTPTPTPTPTPLVSPTPSPIPTATSTPEIEPTITNTPFPTIPPPATDTYEQRLETFNENLDLFYDEATGATGMSRDEINAYFETRALRTALSKIVVEPSTTSVWAMRGILVETEQEALDIIDALNAGESFSDLARVNSTDTGSAAQGGELGWADASLYVDEFAEPVRTLPVGEISTPVQTDFGYHIIQVNARENREIAESQIDQKRQEAFDEWVSGLRDKEEYNYEIKDAWIDHVPSDPPFIYRPR